MDNRVNSFRKSRMNHKEKINEAYQMLREGIPPSVVAQTLDLPIKDIIGMSDSRCV